MISGEGKESEITQGLKEMLGGDRYVRDLDGGDKLLGVYICQNLPSYTF